MVKSFLLALPLLGPGHGLLRLFLLVFSALAPAAVQAQQAGSLEPAFDPGYGIDAGASALAVQPDGRILVGGAFSHVDSQACGGLARLNAGGSVDASFHLPAFAGTYGFESAEIDAIALQTDGRILVGGAFTRVDGQPHAGLVRLRADGSVDEAFSPSFDRLDGVYHSFQIGVRALAIQKDGRIVAAGVFSSVNGQARRGVVRLDKDGTLDGTFDPAAPQKVFPAQGLDDDAFSPALGPDGEVYVAGNFRTVNGRARPALARLRARDGNLDTGFGPAAIDTAASVWALACQPDGSLLVGGSFVQPGGGLYRGDLARFRPNGSADEGFSRAHGSGLYDSSSIRAVVVQPRDGSILVAGDHLYLNGQSSGPAGRYLADGRVDKTFYPGLEPLAQSGSAPSLDALALRPDGRVIVTGDFDAVDGTLRARLAALRGSPSAACPLVSVAAQEPVVLVPSFGEESEGKAGVLRIRIQNPSPAALTLGYSVAGKAVALVATGTFETKTWAIPAGGRKARRKVVPGVGAAFVVGRGKSLELSLQAGRGYAVGQPGSARLRFIPSP